MKTLIKSGPNSPIKLSKTTLTETGKYFRDHWRLYLLLVLPLAYIIVFKYIPMYGVQIAFKRFSPRRGILGSPWVGFHYFRLFIESYQFKRTLINTITLSLYGLVAGFPFPILLALSLNEVRSRRFKKTVQMISYLPHFISTVIVVGILYQFLSLHGVLNNVVDMLGGDRVSYLNNARLFKSIYVWSGVWQGVGYSSIIYLAALSSVDVELYDAGRIDGMNLFQKIRYIDIPAITPTIVILFILSASRVMSVGFEKVYLMQNPLNMSTSDVINTYVYRVGLQGANYSMGTAVGLFTSVINLIILVTLNRVSKIVSETSLW
jgi:putative aldouronate transport system permease protein